MDIIHSDIPSYLSRNYIPETNITASSILRYLPLLAKYDTWRTLKYNAKIENFPTILKVIRYGLKKGFISIHNEYNKKTGRVFKKFVINPGKYHIKTKDLEGILEIDVKQGRDFVLIVNLKINYKL